MKQIKLSLLFILLSVFAAYAQPKLITKIPDKSTNFTKVGELLYFTSGDTLFKSDGTAPGTVIVKTGLKNPGQLLEFNGLLYFGNNSGTGGYSGVHKELFRSDGTASGTYSLFKSSQYFNILSGAGNLLFFRAATASTGLELYRTDGTKQGTFLLKDVNPGTGDGASLKFTVRGSELFFFAYNPATGKELWKSDGTKEGTVIVKDLNPGSADGVAYNDFLRENKLITFNNEVYFEGFGINGAQLYKTNGTTSGTMLYKEFERMVGENEQVAAGGVNFYATHNNNLYFSYHPAWTSTDALIDLYVTNGSAENTTLLHQYGDLYGGGNELYRFVEHHEKLYFFFSRNNFSSSFWETDGTQSGTQLIADPVTQDGYVRFAKVVNDQVVFYQDGQGYYFAFFKNTGSGIEQFAPINYAYDDPQAVNTTNYLFYADYTQNVFNDQPEEAKWQLFQSDVSGSVRVKDLYGISLSGTSNITRFGEKIYFKTLNKYSEDPTDHIAKLWIYDPQNNITPNINFNLVNAASNTIIGNINHGDSIMYSTGVDQINISVTPSGTAGSVVFRLDGKVVRTENGAPYTLAGDNGSDYYNWNATYGPHILTATVYSGANGTGSILEEKSITFRVVTSVWEEQITFTLVNADTDQDIAVIYPGTNFYLSQIGTNKLNIRATTNRPETQSIVFEFKEYFQNQTTVKTENTAPYAVFGDNNGDYAVKYFAEGSYLLKATSYSGKNGSGIIGIPAQTNFWIVDDSNFNNNMENRTSSDNTVDEQLNLNVFPVPAMTNVSFTTAENGEVMLVDNKGIAVYQSKASKGLNTIEVTDLSEGMYLLKFVGETKTLIEKIVISK